MDQAYLFNRGQDFMSYNLLGSRPATGPSGEAGFFFAVWAPAARQVAVSGSFNQWDEQKNLLEPMGSTGIWAGFASGAAQWDRYKYAITGPDGLINLKADPYARHSETRPDTASILYDPEDYLWRDDAYMASRPDALAVGPLNIYEVHLGSWKRHKDGQVINYRDLAEDLGSYLCEMGYNAVELMPVMEHPLDDSWGYQVTGYYSVTSRFGLPSDFKYLVDHLHQQGIRVILDWVPAHFPRDAHGLARFDGTPLYEHADSRMGEHREWGTYAFDFGKCEVRSFLISNAWFWLNEFHIDGLRVDAVSSMLYLNYGRTDFLPNKDGGNDNLDAVSLLRQLNLLIRDRLPACLMIAEESTAWAKVSHPVADGGLGFSHKWNMGWMHDTLEYMGRDFIHRRWHQNQLSFSLMYAFSERFVLPFSHDEVVHGKRSLIDRMPGDIWQKFAGLRALFVYQMTHPGAKLLFMGGEFGQFIEWRFNEQLEWFLLQYDSHRLLMDFVRKINHYYLNQPALWQLDTDWNGFCWIAADDAVNSIYAYIRRDGADEERIVILNLTPSPRASYSLGVPWSGTYRVDLNSDDMAFGGSGYPLGPVPGQHLEAVPSDLHGQPARLTIDLPPLCGLILRPDNNSDQTIDKREE